MDGAMVADRCKKCGGPLTPDVCESCFRTPESTPCGEPDCGVTSVSGSGTPSIDYCSRGCYDRAQAEPPHYPLPFAPAVCVCRRLARLCYRLTSTGGTT